ncbi:hypothetical protein QP938_11380 [Porticoccaceae bacterium LTM1]|nr:hypothetical protein QP938_11380 [Porticoccaceae bacterium LTM1]
MNALSIFSRVSKKALTGSVAAGALLAIGCAGVSSIADPAKPSLLEVSPDAKVYPIGQVPLLNVGDRFPFDDYPVAAIRNISTEPPKVGCVMVEVLVGEDGRVKRTAIAEEYPRGYFRTEVMRDARVDRYPKQSGEIITYHFYQFDIDQNRDTGLIKTSWSGSATEVTLEMNVKRRYENMVRSETGWSTTINTLVQMPKQCKSLYNKYAAPFPEVAKSESPETK